VFDTAPILWLQSFATPWLTTSMNVVSLLGYSHCCLAVAALVAFGWKLRGGVALFVIVALTAVLVSLAKFAWAAPRPDAVDSRVQHLTIYRLRPPPDPAPRADDEDRFGFPSGHVATTTALFMGIAVLAQRRWVWALAAGAATLMALSRMYLGRHFPGDVLGGLALGAIAFNVGWYALRLRTLASPGSTDDPRPLRIVLILIAGAVSIASLAAGIPSPHEAGRLAGISLAAATLLRPGATGETRSVLARLAALGFSLLLIGLAVVWDVAPHIIGGGAVTTRSIRLVVAAMINGAAIRLPVSALRLSRP
jgi:membrane-associated phospholipid phosphatase